jgi:hypothetical protein
MIDEKLDIPQADFPNEVEFCDKSQKDYGLKIGRAIQHEWFRRDTAGCRFYSQMKMFNELRLYARGEQSIAKYKNEMAVDGDLSFLNLDWTPIPIMPKFIDIVVNGMSERVMKVKAYAQDAISQSNRSKYQMQIEGQAAAKDILSVIKESTGADPFIVDPDELPSSEEETQLHMQLKYKPAIEIAEEQAINTIFDENKYDDIRRRLNYDAAVIGVAMAKHEYLHNEGIKISYVDPANVVYSYTECPDFKDCFYWGEVKVVPITELRKINPNLEEKDIEHIVKTSGLWNSYFGISNLGFDDLYSKNTTTLLYFNYKTTKRVVYKKKILDNGAVRVVKKDESFNPPEEMMADGKFSKVEKYIDVWYDGVMVLGTDIILKWELSENMVRPKSASQFAIPNYVAFAPRMYKGRIESLAKRMVPLVDLAQMTHLKLQQVINKVVPDGVFLDADGVNEVDLGDGGVYSPKDALRLYFQTGSVIGRSYTQDGEYNNARIPIQQLESRSGASKVQMLLANYEHYLNMIRGVTGLNEARDGSMPDDRALVGVQKMAAMSSNTATRHILDTGIYMYKSLAESITYRISDIIKYSDAKEEFINQIGRYNVSLLEEISELYLYDFGIFIEVAPDEEQKAQLEANIQMAISKGDINLEDAIDIRELRNLKLANQLLKLKRIRKQDMESKSAMQRDAILAQRNLESQKIAAELSVMKIQKEGEMKLLLKDKDLEVQTSILTAEATLKRSLMKEEFMYNMQLHKSQFDTSNSIEDKKEREKNNRIKMQSTQQSVLINQRKNNLPPVNFESNEDSLDGFSLEEFEPR